MPTKTELTAKIEALREVSLSWQTDDPPFLCVHIESNVARLIEKYEGQLAAMKEGV